MPRGSPEPIPGRCGARLKNANPQLYCATYPIKGGNGRCRMHNGKAVAGPAHPSYKHGRYSRVLKPEFRRAIAELMADPDVLSLVDNIRLTDVQIMKVTEQMQDAAVAADWNKARLILAGAADAMQAEDATALGHALADLKRLFDKGAEADTLRRKLMVLQDARRRLVRTEAQRLAANRAAISVDKAIGLIMVLVDIMFRHISDAATRRAIIADVRALEVLPGKYAIPAEVPS